MLAGRGDEVVLHAGILQGHLVEALSQPRRGAVRGRKPQGRHRRPDEQVACVSVLDYNGDLWPDIFVANDTQPNKLYRNNKNGTFTDDGLTAGVAYSEDGVARGAMGVDSSDYDRSGRASPASWQLLESDARPLSQQGPRAVRG